MSLYRQPKSDNWYVRFSVGGIKVRKSAFTTDREKANEYESKLRADLWRQVKLGERPRYTWADAVKRWAAEADNREKDRDRDRLAWFETGAQDIRNLALVDITRDVIENLRGLKADETSRANANRLMCIFRMILRKAHREWDWVDKSPVVPMYRLEKTEPRFLTVPQYNRLKKHLPKHLRDIVEFLIETGLRMRNGTHLTWDQVDLRRALVIVPAGKAKSGATLSVPLSRQAVAVLRRQKRVKDEPRVFLYQGRPFDDANTEAFKKAARKAGVPWLRVHDTRHTWASWHVQRGTPLHVLQKLGGWASLAMVQVYAHLNPGVLRAHVEHGKGIPRRGQVANSG